MGKGQAGNAGNQGAKGGYGGGGPSGGKGKAANKGNTGTGFGGQTKGPGGSWSTGLKSTPTAKDISNANAKAKAEAQARALAQEDQKTHNAALAAAKRGIPQSTSSTTSGRGAGATSGYTGGGGQGTSSKALASNKAQLGLGTLSNMGKDFAAGIKSLPKEYQKAIFSITPDILRDALQGTITTDSVSPNMRDKTSPGEIDKSNAAKMGVALGTGLLAPLAGKLAGKIAGPLANLAESKIGNIAEKVGLNKSFKSYSKNPGAVDPDDMTDALLGKFAAQDAAKATGKVGVPAVVGSATVDTANLGKDISDSLGKSQGQSQGQAPGSPSSSGGGTGGMNSGRSAASPSSGGNLPSNQQAADAKVFDDLIPTQAAPGTPEAQAPEAPTPGAPTPTGPTTTKYQATGDRPNQGTEYNPTTASPYGKEFDSLQERRRQAQLLKDSPDELARRGQSVLSQYSSPTERSDRNMKILINKYRDKLTPKGE